MVSSDRSQRGPPNVDDAVSGRVRSSEDKEKIPGCCGLDEGLHPGPLSIPDSDGILGRPVGRTNGTGPAVADQTRERTAANFPCRTETSARVPVPKNDT